MADATWTPNPDGTGTLTLPLEPPISLVIKPAELLRLIKSLGELALTVKPTIPDDWQAGQKVLFCTDPTWHAATDVMTGNGVLHLKDPRFGWLHYSFPQESVKKIAGHMQTEILTGKAN
jgi:hypothetical protein